MDGDGYPNTCDNCELIRNETQSDVNGDGYGDACQPDDLDQDGWPGPNATDGDSDNDGIPDVEDNCEGVQTSNTADIDSDGIGNACEVGDDDGDGFGIEAPASCTYGLSPIPCICSSSMNLITNCSDNCPGVPNPSLLDSDGDQVGDRAVRRLHHVGHTSWRLLHRVQHARTPAFCEASADGANSARASETWRQASNENVTRAAALPTSILHLIEYCGISGPCTLSLSRCMGS